MSLRLVLLSLLFTAVFVCGEDSDTSNNELDLSAKEGRALIEVPIIGSIIFIVSKLCSLATLFIPTLIQFKISFVSAIIQLKMAALSFFLSIPSLIYQHFVKIAVTTVAIIGYCVGTSLTSLFSSAPVEEYDIDHRLFYAARNLEQANNRYIGLE